MKDKLKSSAANTVGSFVPEFLAMMFFMFIACVLTVKLGNPAMAGIAWGAAPVLPILVFGRRKAGQLNTGVTAGALAGGQLPLYTATLFWVAQVLAGVTGIYLAAFYCTGRFDRNFAWQFVARPAEGFDLWRAGALEGFSVFGLTLVALAIGKGEKTWAEWLVIGVAIGVVLGGLVALTGPMSGGAINPARALAPWLIARPEEGLGTLIMVHLLPGLAGGFLTGAVHRTYGKLAS